MGEINKNFTVSLKRVYIYSKNSDAQKIEKLIKRRVLAINGRAKDNRKNTLVKGTKNWLHFDESGN